MHILKIKWLILLLLTGCSTNETRTDIKSCPDQPPVLTVDQEQCVGTEITDYLFYRYKIWEDCTKLKTGEQDAS